MFRSAPALVAAALLVTSPAYAAGSFHPAQSEGEKALETILRKIDKVEGSANYFYGENTDEFMTAADRAKLGKLATPGFIKATTDFAQEAQKKCKAAGAELCAETDFHPVTCGNDNLPTKLLYNTLSAAADQVTIKVKETGTYMLVRRDGIGWQIDKVKCAFGD